MSYAKHLSQRRGAFLAEHRRQPTPEEEREMREAAREDAKAAEAERHENELRRAYLGQPGATEAGWAQEKSAILEKDRAERTLANREAARRAQSALYVDF
jgi:hypothetical protein